MCARNTLVCALVVLLGACAGAHQRFGEASLAFADGVTGRNEGNIAVATAQHERGIGLTRELVAKYPEAPLVQAILADRLAVGPYKWSTIDQSLAARVAFWAKFEQDLLARAFFEAELVAPDDGRLELLVAVVEALSEAGRDSDAGIAMAVALDATRPSGDLTRDAWAQYTLASAYQTLGASDKALEHVENALDQITRSVDLNGTADPDLISELLVWAEELPDNESAMAVLDGLAMVAEMLVPEEEAATILDQVAFAMARKGDCTAAQAAMEMLMAHDLPMDCDCYDAEEPGTEDQRVRLEAFFDLFDECVDRDPDAARIILQDAEGEAFELGWQEYLADVAWGYAMLEDLEAALEIARSLENPVSRIDALLAIADEIDEDRGENTVSPLDLYLEATEVSLAGESLKTRIRYRCSLAQHLAVAGDQTRARDNALQALDLLRQVPAAERVDVLRIAQSASIHLDDGARDKLMVLARETVAAHKHVAVKLQSLMGSFDAYLSMADNPRAAILLDDAVTVAAGDESLEDPSFWCNAARGYAALGNGEKAVAQLKHLSDEARNWCLLDIGQASERTALPDGLKPMVDKARGAVPPATSPAEFDDEPRPDCKTGIDNAYREYDRGASRVHALLRLHAVCPDL